MARLNTTVLVLQATDVGFRLNQVQSDPAVRKAGREAEAFRFRNPNIKGECGCGESFAV